MKRFTSLHTVGLSAVVAFAAVPWVAGCGSAKHHRHGKHVVSAVPADQEMKCRMCYDEAVRVRSKALKSTPGKSHIVKKHMCPSCNSDMTIYQEDGKAMIKCQSCAPEGVACDRCLPPKSN